jgi:hypothetical protein
MYPTHHTRAAQRAATAAGKGAPGAATTDKMWSYLDLFFYTCRVN